MKWIRDKRTGQWDGMVSNERRTAVIYRDLFYGGWCAVVLAGSKCNFIGFADSLALAKTKAEEFLGVNVFSGSKQ